MSNSRPSLAVWLYGNPYPSIHRMIMARGFILRR